MNDYERDRRMREQGQHYSLPVSRSPQDIERPDPYALPATRPIEPVSWNVDRYERDAAYAADTRILQAAVMAEHAVNAITEVHGRINQLANGGHPALVAELRDLEVTLAKCSALLIARYMGR